MPRWNVHVYYFIIARGRIPQASSSFVVVVAKVGARARKSHFVIKSQMEYVTHGTICPMASRICLVSLGIANSPRHVIPNKSAQRRAYTQRARTHSPSELPAKNFIYTWVKKFFAALTSIQHLQHCLFDWHTPHTACDARGLEQGERERGACATREASVVVLSFVFGR